MKRLLLFAIINSSIVVPARAQVAPEDHAVREFLVAAYPELAGRALEIRTHGRWGAKDISVSEVIPDGSVASRRRPLLDARVRFSTSHALKYFSASGPFLRDAENAELQRVLTNATATGRDVGDEIVAQDLPFGPDRRGAVLERIERMRLDERLGAIEVTTATPTITVGNEQYGFLWTVELRGMQRDGPRYYVVQLEPIGGHLVSLSER